MPWGKIGIFLIIISIISFCMYVYQEKKIQTRMENYIEITNEQELREAIKGEQKIYKCKNMVVSGEACVDKFNILNDNYIAIEYRQFRCKRRPKSILLEWIYNDEIKIKSDKLVLFNDIPLECGDYEPYYHSFIKLEDKVKLEAKNKLGYAGGNYYYYPNSTAEEIDNIRYEVRGIECNTQIAFLAEVGEGKVKLISLKKDKQPSITAANDESGLEFSLDESAGAWAAISIISLLVGIGMIIISIALHFLL